MTHVAPSRNCSNKSLAIASIFAFHANTRSRKEQCGAHILLNLHLNKQHLNEEQHFFLQAAVKISLVVNCAKLVRAILPMHIEQPMNDERKVECGETNIYLYNSIDSLLPILPPASQAVQDCCSLFLPLLQMECLPLSLQIFQHQCVQPMPLAPSPLFSANPGCFDCPPQAMLG